VTRRSVSPASMVDQVGRAIATADGADFESDAARYRRLARAALKPFGRLPATLRSALLSALAERDETADVCFDTDGRPEPDPELRDYENVPRKETVQSYFDREVKPHVPDAWVDDSKTRDGYEIPFTRQFFRFVVLRPPREIEADIRRLEAEIHGKLAEALRP